MRAILAACFLAAVASAFVRHPLKASDLKAIREAKAASAAGEIMLEQCHDTYCNQNCTFTRIPKDTCFPNQDAQFTCTNNTGGYCIALMDYNPNVTTPCSVPMGLTAATCDTCQKADDGSYSVFRNCHSFADARYDSGCNSDCSTCKDTKYMYRYACKINPADNSQWEALEYFPCDRLVTYETYASGSTCSGAPTNKYNFPERACVSDLTGQQPEFNSWRYHCPW